MVKFSQDDLKARCFSIESLPKAFKKALKESDNPSWWRRIKSFFLTRVLKKPGDCEPFFYYLSQSSFSPLLDVLFDKNQPTSDKLEANNYLFTKKERALCARIDKYFPHLEDLKYSHVAIKYLN